MRTARKKHASRREREEVKGMFEQIIERREKIAKQIAQVLSENQATCFEMEDIFKRVSAYLVVSMAE